MDFFNQADIDLLVSQAKVSFNRNTDSTVYDNLKSLYEKVGYWANAVQKEFAPNGKVDIRKRPTNQGNKFEVYQWAKIYPRDKANKNLAYTLSIEQNNFVIKIDTVGLEDKDSTRKKYLSYRGDWGNSKIVVILSSSDVLSMNWTSLISRSVEELTKLKPYYEELYKLLFQIDVSTVEPTNSPTESHNNTDVKPRNIILYGPPGTGKTYNTIDLAVSLCEGTDDNGATHADNKSEFDRLRKEGQIEFVTFHQNYSYEDFMVGLRPHTEGSQLAFTEHKGIFYKLCERAKQNYLSQSQEGYSKEPTFEEVFYTFLQPLIDEEKEISVPMKANGYTFAITKQTEDGLRLKFRKQSGGTGHDLVIATIKYIYEDTQSFSKEGLGVYYYPLVGVLKDIAKTLTIHIESETLKHYVLVIDEINRANISRVFGELITLLEDDKRIGKQHALNVTLPNGKEDFGIPPNLHIVGTMNTADKSIALVDIALRRRFEFIGKYPTYIPDAYHYTQEKAKFLKKINDNIIEKGKKSADFLIGHAYLMKDETMQIVIKNKIIPLLMEYFSNRLADVQSMFDGTDWQIKYDTNTYDWVITPKPQAT